MSSELPGIPLSGEAAGESEGDIAVAGPSAANQKKTKHQTLN